MTASLLRIADRLSDFSRTLARITGVLIIFMMIGVVFDAILRGVLGIAIWGVLEVSVLLLLALIYFGLPSTLSLRENFRVSILADILPGWIGNPIAWLQLGLQFAVMCMLTWFTWRSAIYSFERQEVAIGLVEIPLWPMRTTVALGFTMLALQTIVLAIQFAFRGQHPYAVSIEDEIRDELGDVKL